MYAPQGFFYSQFAHHARGEGLEHCRTSIQANPWHAHILPPHVLRDTIVQGQPVRRLLALLESTGTEQGRRHPVLARTAMQEKLLSKKERRNVRLAQKDPTAKMPRQLRLALLESTGTERD